MVNTIPGPDFSDRTWSNWVEPQFVDVDGLPTAYRRAGSGPTLVYLHPGGGTRSWPSFPDALSKNFDVIAPEHPGFGDTARPANIDSWPDFVLHYDAFFRALGLENFHLVGSSFGAWIAANLAIYYPERYASLTLITPLGTRIEDEPFIDVFRFSGEEDFEAVFNGRGAALLPELAQGSMLETAITNFYESTTAALLFFNPRYDYKLDVRLQRVQVPTLVVGVEDDRIAGNLQAARFHQLIPGSDLITIPGPDGQPSAHGVVFEQPGDVATVIVDYVASKALTQEVTV